MDEKQVELSEEEKYVEILDENDNIIKCDIYDVIDYEGRSIVLLSPIEDNEDDEVIVMEYIEETEEDGYFQRISDEDFVKISAYIESLEDEEE